MSQNKSVDVGRPADDRELRDFVALAARALSFEDADVDLWARREGQANMRVARVGDEVVGGLTVQRMGQWFGGRSVPMGGVRAVAVAPEHRGCGIASSLLRVALREMYEDGVALSALYPATQTVYRKSGYAPAGLRTGYRVPAGAIDVDGRKGRVRPIEPEDFDAVAFAYTERAKRGAGLVDRNEWLWQRILDPPSWMQKTTGYVFEGGGGIEGYLFCANLPRDKQTHRFNLGLTDFVALTPQSGRCLLGFLAGYRSVVNDIEWFGAPVDPTMLLLSEEIGRATFRMDWMLRLVDVEAALTARGYAPAVRGEVHLDVADDILPENEGRLILEVTGGGATVRKGGRGSVRVDVRSLATVYSGHLSPLALRSIGAIEGEETELATLGALFAGPAPWMPDMF